MDDREVQGEAGHGREMDVEQQDIRVLGREQLVGRLGTPGGQDAVAMASQDPLQHAAQAGFVVHHQDRGGVGLRDRGVHHDALTARPTGGVRKPPRMR